MSGGARRGFVIVAALGLATWMCGGYAFGVWPQIFPLEHILHLSGRLENDWYTAHAAPHWLFDHALALLPEAWLAPVAAVLWLAALALFWAGFRALGADLGLGEPAILAAGLIGARTAFAGLGSTALLMPCLYPSALAAVGWLWALRESLAGRARRAGIATGLTLLVHPQMGALAVITTGGVLLRTTRPAAAARAVALALLVGAISLLRLVVDLGRGNAIPPARQFDLLARLRLPHHFVYAAFPPAEYAAVACWAALLVVALARLRRAAPASPALAGWPMLIATLAALCATGAAASAAGWPLAWVEVQTARASAWIPLLGLIAAAAAIAGGSAARRPARGATLLLFATPLAAELLGRPLHPLLAAVGLGALPRHALQAIVLLGLVGWGWRRGTEPAAPAAEAPGAPPLARPPWTYAAAVAALAALSFVAAGWRGPPRAAIEPDWAAIAAASRGVSAPRDVFLIPPDQDAFRYLSHRPIVVDFGEMCHDDLEGWRQRLVDVTGAAWALGPLPLRPNSTRVAWLAAAYDSTVFRSRAVADRYGVRYVVARRAVAPAPRWLEPVTSNATYALYRVRPRSVE